MTEKPKSSPRKSPPAKRKARPRRLWVVYLLFLTAGLCGVAAQWAWSELRRADQQPDPIELTITYINSQNQTIEALIRQTEVAVSRTAYAAQDGGTAQVRGYWETAEALRIRLEETVTPTQPTLLCEDRPALIQIPNEQYQLLIQAFDRANLIGAEVGVYVSAQYLVCYFADPTPTYNPRRVDLFITLYPDSEQVVAEQLAATLEILDQFNLARAENGEIQIAFVLPTETRTLRALFIHAMEAWRSGVRGDALIAVFTIVTQ
jgi:hypothetical protein